MLHVFSNLHSQNLSFNIRGSKRRQTQNKHSLLIILCARAVRRGAEAWLAYCL